MPVPFLYLGTSGSSSGSAAGYFFDALSDADALAATVRGLAAYKATSSADDRAEALEAAADRIDAAMRYQGRKFDETQPREFPRVAYGSALPYQMIPQPFPYSGNTIWDWDDANSVAIVPVKVKKANLFEADALLQATASEREERLQAIADGVVSQSVGSLSESYHKQDLGPSGLPRLCLDANTIMRFYMFRSGQSV